jgi:hypothetical protein
VKNKPVKSNCPSDGTSKAAPAKQREDAQPIQSGKTVHRRPADEDYRFDKLKKEEEYEPCFRYEIFRERINQFRAIIIKEASEIDISGESEAEKFRQKLELQEQLDELKRADRPWLKLTDAEKPTRREESVREMTPMDRWLRKKNASPAVEGIELSIDFRNSTNDLMASFHRLLTKMRKERKIEFKNAGRPHSIKLRLFNLTVYRCLQRGMKPDEVWEHLAPLREKFWIGEQNRTKLLCLSGKIEREIGVRPF